VLLKPLLKRIHARGSRGVELKSIFRKISETGSQNFKRTRKRTRNRATQDTRRAQNEGDRTGIGHFLPSGKSTITA